MNLTRIIEITGKRLRQGKIYSEHLTNAQIKLVLETAIEVMQEALLEEGRIEIQNFAVLEVKRTQVRNPNTLSSKTKQGKTIKRQISSTRIRWLFKPSKKLRGKVKNLRGHLNIPVR